MITKERAIELAKRYRAKLTNVDEHTELLEGMVEMILAEGNPTSAPAAEEPSVEPTAEPVPADSGEASPEGEAPTT